MTAITGRTFKALENAYLRMAYAINKEASIQILGIQVFPKERSVIKSRASP
jgi:hypothetical protein